MKRFVNIDAKTPTHIIYSLYEGELDELELYEFILNNINKNAVKKYPHDTHLFTLDAPDFIKTVFKVKKTMLNYDIISKFKKNIKSKKQQDDLIYNAVSFLLMLCIFYPNLIYITIDIKPGARPRMKNKSLIEYDYAELNICLYDYFTIYEIEEINKSLVKENVLNNSYLNRSSCFYSTFSSFSILLDSLQHDRKLSRANFDSKFDKDNMVASDPQILVITDYIEI